MISRAIHVLLFLFLTSSSVLATEPEVIFGPGYRPTRTDTSVLLSFKPPTAYKEYSDLAQRNGFYKAYLMPSSDGNSRSAFTVTFQAKSATPGLRNLKEFVSKDLYYFKQTFPNSIIAEVKVEGIVAEKFSKLGFPMETFMFKGDKSSDKVNGDSLTLFFETPMGFWSIVWTVPQRAMKLGFPVFERFIQDMTVQKLYDPNPAR